MQKIKLEINSADLNSLKFVVNKIKGEFSEKIVCKHFNKDYQKCIKIPNERNTQWMSDEDILKIIKQIDEVSDDYSIGPIEYKRLAKILKAKSGIPDFVVARKNNKPFFVEVKYGASKLQSNQETKIQKIKDEGYNVYIVYLAECVELLLPDHMEIESSNSYFERKNKN